MISSDNGFSREFRLVKNLGLSGWMLNLNPQDIEAFPKVRMKVMAKVYATRGFKQIESKEFAIPISGGGQWEITPESINEFSVGGKRRIVIKNTLGSCRCLQSVKYRPSFGGEFTFSANSASNPIIFNHTGTEAWFEIDTTNFLAGEGTIEFRAYGNEQQPQNTQLTLYPGPPENIKAEAHRGDKMITLEGNGIDQMEAVSINGKQAQFVNESDPDTQANRKTFIFQNPSDLILENKVSLKLTLSGNREYKYPESFKVLPARPAIEANEQKEIEAVVIEDTNAPKRTKGFDLSEYPIIAVDTENLTVSVKTTLADYAFKTENISIETRIENGQVGGDSLPQPAFEVLDSFNLRINFVSGVQYEEFLAGRRLQFRIKDRHRGDSDWYTIRQTFVRLPKIDSVRCAGEECKISGRGLDYIGQISTDGGGVWQPPLAVQPTTDGKSFMIVNGVKNKSQLRIKLRDFQNTKGLPL